jgi:hypothetical protein
MTPKNRWVPLAASLVLCAAGAVHAQSGDAPSAAGLSSDEIVQRMERSNQSRSDELKHYTAVRHYQVNYKGFGAKLGATMDVEVSYDAPGEKKFRIVSQSGSKVLIDKVLKRLVETEKEATGNGSATALTAANYNFTLEGGELLEGRPAYILSVQPLTGNKLLYRGRIWVDAADFAVVKIDAQPARNPSLWIASTRINHTYAKTGSFWLPRENRTESKIRIGGTAVLTIDYGTYKIQAEATQLAGK